MERLAVLVLLVSFAGVSLGQDTTTPTDTTPPMVMNCPVQGVFGVATAGSNTALVVWTTPTAVDNSGGTVTVASNATSGQSFSVGTTSVEYTFTDPSNNLASCRFQVIVSQGSTDNIAPVVSGCPVQGSTVNALPGQTAVAVTWIEPTAIDNSGGPVILMSNNEPGSFYQVGYTLIRYTFMDASGNQAFCSFVVTVTGLPNKCDPNPCSNDATCFNRDRAEGYVCECNRPNESGYDCSTFSDSQVVFTCYGAECSSGVFNSINYPNDYPHRYLALYLIYVPGATGFTFTFDTPFQVENVKDKLYVGRGLSFALMDLNGVNTMSPDVVFFEGLAAPDSFYFTNTDAAWIYFLTDKNIAYSGFQVRWSVVDNQPPVITNCPVDLIRPASINAPVSVIWPQLVVNDGGQLTFTQTHSSGDAFPVGTTVVTYVYTDQGGLISVCRFNVIVNLVQSFQITCANQVTASGQPGTPVSVPIPQPTVPAGLNNVTFRYFNHSNQQFQGDYNAVVPASGTTTRNIRVEATSANGATAECTIPVLISTEIPDRPTDVRIIDRTDDSLRIKWKAGSDGGTKQSFVVSHQVVQDTTPNEIFSSSISLDESTDGQQTFSVSNLQPLTEYEIRVYAENSLGRNPQFDSVMGLTLREAPSSITGPVVGAVVGVALLVLVCIIVVYFAIRRKRRIKSKDARTARSVGSTPNEIGRQRQLSEEQVYEDMLELTDQHGGAAAYSTLITGDKMYPRDSLKIVKKLGEGAFGQVLLCEADGIIQPSTVTKVAVKTLKEGAQDDEKNDMMRELNLMKKFPNHPNVVRLLGYCEAQQNEPPYIILEYLSRGNLKDILTDSRSKGGRVYGNLHGVSKSLSSNDLIKFAVDVADGMNFISSEQCIHRDLAARNVLVAEDMTCKVSDFGLARDVTNVRVYERKSKSKLPLRWMALESILDDMYTTKSDVWSFGVLLWEIVALGARPYPAMTSKTMLSKLQAGYRLPQPQHCEQQLYDMMRSCWEEDPDNRPSFKKLSDALNNLVGEGKDYISILDYKETIYEVTIPEDQDEKV